MRLFFSFYLHDLDLSITCLQNAVCQISSSMTANVLTLSSTKTEFSLVGSHTTASQITRLLAEHQPFSSQSSFYFWWTCRSCHFLKANYGSVYVNPAVLFFVNFVVSDLLYTYQNTQYRRQLNCSLQTQFLQSLYFNLPNNHKNKSY